MIDFIGFTILLAGVIASGGIIYSFKEGDTNPRDEVFDILRDAVLDAFGLTIGGGSLYFAVKELISNLVPIQVPTSGVPLRVPIAVSGFTLIGATIYVYAEVDHLLAKIVLCIFCLVSAILLIWHSIFGSLLPHLFEKLSVGVGGFVMLWVVVEGYVSE